jgi:hypothetical protein
MTEKEPHEPNLGRGPPVVVHASASWYRERPEAEVALTGVLRKRDVPVGPMGRSLDHVLESFESELPIYGAGAETLLDELIGRRITVRAKRVDLTSEGQGIELWLGSIECS